MKLKEKSKIILCCIMSILTITVLGVFSHSAFAAEQKKEYEITLSPTTKQFGAIETGKSYSDKIKITNSGTKSTNFKVYATGYQVTNDRYDTSYEDGKYTKISKWITFEKTSGTIQPDESQEIGYTITVPQDAPGGGEYATIMVEIEGGAAVGGASISSNASVGMIIYSHVNGQVVTCSKVENLSINTFLINPPISANSLVENCGNIDLDAKYTLRVFPLFSDEEIYTNEDDPEKLVILPETKRFYSIAWKNSPSFGIFRVEHEVQIGDQKQSATQYVIICPIWLIVIILLFIGSIVFWFFARRRERKDAAEASKASATKDVKKDDKPSDK